MTMEKFRRCHAVMARWEGGWSDHPADPGGKTMYGITEAVYHGWLQRQGRRLRHIAKQQARIIEAIDRKRNAWHRVFLSRTWNAFSEDLATSLGRWLAGLTLWLLAAGMKLCSCVRVESSVYREHERCTL